MSKQPDVTEVSARGVYVFLDWLIRAGYSKKQLTKGCLSLTMDQEDLRGSLDISELETLLHNAISLSGNDHLGYAFGLQFNVNAYGMLGLAGLSSATIGDAFKVVKKYLPTFTQLFDLHQYEENEKITISVSMNTPVSPDLEHLLIDSLFSSLYTQANFLLGSDTKYCSISMAYPKPKNTTYHLLSGWNFHWESKSYQLKFDASVMKRPLVLADKNALKMALEKCDHLLKKVTKPQNYTHIIRQHLLAMGGPYPSLEKMAEETSISSRTLHRKLTEEGTSYRQILTDVIMVQAQQLLLQNTSVIETAYELGYKDSANFSRAFKKATGETPSAYVSKLSTKV